jgi:hypothetical protein
MPIPSISTARAGAFAILALILAGCSSSSGDNQGGGVDASFEVSFAGTPPCAPGKFGVARPRPGWTSWTSDTYAITASTVDVSTTNGPSHYAATFEGGSFDVTWTGPWEPSDPHAVTSVKGGTLSLPANDSYPSSTWCVHDTTFHRASDHMEIIFDAFPGDCPTPPTDGTVPPPDPPTTPINGCIMPAP